MGGDALQPQQFEQLRMLATPGDLRSMSGGLAFMDHTSGTEESLLHSKLQEATGSGLADSIRSDGVQDPVEVWPPRPGQKRPTWLSGGHHRFAVAEEMEKAGKEMYLPVDYVGGRGHWRKQR